MLFCFLAGWPAARCAFWPVSVASAAGFERFGGSQPAGPGQPASQPASQPVKLPAWLASWLAGAWPKQ
eukprot:9159266-Alexandrium_andersonii.AAC.1